MLRGTVMQSKEMKTSAAQAHCLTPKTIDELHNAVMVAGLLADRIMAGTSICVFDGKEPHSGHGLYQMIEPNACAQTTERQRSGKGNGEAKEERQNNLHFFWPPQTSGGQHSPF